MRSHFFARRFARATRHFTSTRALEVLVLQASPFLGAVFGGGLGDGWSGLGRITLLLAGSIALTAHVFVFNDWAGQTSDLNDPRRVARCFGSAGITSRHVAILAFALLIVAMLLLALLNAVAAVLGAAIAGFSLVYSGSSSWGKRRPIVASLLHLIGGAFHFLLGYGVAHGIDRPGIGIAIFFGLVFAGGHLNQEVRDYEPDLHNGIRTTAVVFGPRCAFFCSLLVFTAAYLLLIALVMVGTLPRLLLWTTILWPWLIACWAHALRNGLGFETATWIQRRYRLQFALLGLAMLLTAPPVIELARRPHQHVRDQIHHATAAGKAG